MIKDFFGGLFGGKAQKNQIYKMFYDSAISRIGNMRPTSSDANEEIHSAKLTLRDRASYAVRNFTIAESIVRGLSTNIVGGGIRPQVVGLGLSVDEKQSIEQKILSILNDYDFSTGGFANFFDMQTMLMRSVVERGEALVLLRRSAKKNFPYSFQPLEADYFDDNRDGQAGNGNRIIQGIEFNGNGERAAYWLYKNHPGSNQGTFENSRIAADQVLHVFRRDRLGQERGITWLAPVLNSIAAFSELQKISLEQQRLSALLSVIVSPDLNTQDEQLKMLLENPPEYKGGQMAVVSPGSTVSLVTPPPQGGSQDFRDSLLNGIATGVGMTAQALFSDYSKVNFSSGRQAELQFVKSLKYWQQSIIVAQFCAPVGRMILNHLKRTNGASEQASIEWVLPSREHIQPREEASAAAVRIAAGITSRAHEQRKMGIDPENIQGEINKDIEQYGVTDLSKLIVSAPGDLEND